MSIREAGAGPTAPTVLVPEATCVLPASLILSATMPASFALAKRSFLTKNKNESSRFTYSSCSDSTLSVTFGCPSRSQRFNTSG